ncbi:putative BCCT family transporter [Streptomyces sp. Tu6071]|uniref:BCCT family transporter n=1 Tax=Streptomyces evansiae TaxID=3075535 RepID=A0ABD5EDR9_9ACTN|nr:MULTISPECIES: BCCT family transporter [unclassified Streptomyces]EGJ75527.1 putative BCCT family transporter [Streptomyces sp. Tu6071]MDT0419216.1 BCCT family transporter [Streptomyces sp. DSM 41982]SCE30759.1 choline/carnitine/betaine transport [Streptomyces sp. SolWspMP-sol7th]
MSTPHEESAPPEAAQDNSPDRVVVALGALGVLGIVLWAALGKGSFDAASGAALPWVLDNFAWLFVIAADVFLILSLYLAFGRYGRIRLGGDDARPEFRNFSWIAMMFSAGMGIGLIFYGVGEPVAHYLSPPPGSGARPRTQAAASVAMQYSFFHWTLTPWAIYGIAGLALAYTTFRKGRGNRLSAVFAPLIGERAANGVLGRVLDLLAVFATVFGTATSLGIGALQIATGLDLTAGLDTSKTVELLIIVVLSAAFVISAFTGLHGGVKWLSSVNLVIAAVLMVFVFVTGPTVFLLDALPSSAGGYLDRLVAMASSTGAFGDEKWLGAWTIFYWAWWLSWAPFVGTFIARISRGRTIREFLLAVLLVPSGATALWFVVLGGTGIRLDRTGAVDMAAKAEEGTEATLFAMLDALPLPTVTAWVAMVLIMMYFVTSADSASLVMGSLTSRGALHPRRWLVITWGVLMAAVAGALLLAGGLDSLQSATILVALPFVVVMLFLCWALLRELRADPGAGPKRSEGAHGLRDAVRALVGEELRSRPVRTRRLPPEKPDGPRP